MRGTLATRSTRRVSSVPAQDSFTRADSATVPGLTEVGGRLWVPNFGLQGVFGGYLYLGGGSGNYASAPDTAALSITDDMDVRAFVAPNDWTPTANTILVSKWGSGTTRSYQFYIDTAGKLEVFISTTGADANGAVSSAATGLTDLSSKWVRFTRQRSSGQVKFWTADDGASWTQLGTTQTTTTGACFDSTSILEIGTNTVGTGGLFAGKVFRVQIRNNILDDGTGVVFDADFSKPAAAARSFTEDSSNAATVTINGGAWGISSNTAYCAVTSGTNFLAAETYHSGVDVQATLTTVNDGIGIGFRYQDPLNYLTWLRVGASTRCYKLVAGVSTAIGPTAVANAVNGDVDVVQCRGQQIQVLRNGAVVYGPFQDTTFQYATRHGLVTNGTQVPRFDNFKVIAA